MKRHIPGSDGLSIDINSCEIFDKHGKCCTLPSTEIGKFDIVLFGKCEKSRIALVVTFHNVQSRT